MTNKVKDNWYKDFFQGINCELWEKAVSPDWTIATYSSPSKATYNLGDQQIYIVAEKK